MSRNQDQGTEPDRYDGTPHPREQPALFGHEQAEMAFLDGIRSGRLHHAWLIGGPEGIGKATLAYRVARCLLGLRAGSPDPGRGLAVDPASPAARQVAALSHPNLAVLRRTPATDKKAASATIPVDAVRRALSVFGTTAADGGYRVCIVDSAEDLTISSANALLKVIEEPPPRSIFLVVSHAPQRVLPTIRSRCRRLLLRPLGADAVRSVIAVLGSPWADAPADLLDDAVRLGEGSVRRTLDMLDEDKIAFLKRIAGALDALPRTEPRTTLALAEELARRDADAAYDLALEAVQRWVGRRLQERAALGPARLAPLVEVCEKVARSAREIDTYNLDRRPLVLALFDDLAEAVRRTA
ncbi:MAG TPA: DNA polymerase III subunit delta' [Microvirga sp.]|nr:DNA polymerase III subunit delta' [Microvirga sp.]